MFCDNKRYLLLLSLHFEAMTTRFFLPTNRRLILELPSYMCRDQEGHGAQISETNISIDVSSNHIHPLMINLVDNTNKCASTYVLTVVKFHVVVL